MINYFNDILKYCKANYIFVFGVLWLTLLLAKYFSVVYALIVYIVFGLIAYNVMLQSLEHFHNSYAGDPALAGAKEEGNVENEG